MKTLIREYAVSDFPQIKKLVLEAENFGEPFLENEILNIKKNTTPGLGKIFVATIGQQVVGFISLGRRVFALMVDAVIVEEGFQRKNIGEKLIKKAKEYAISQGFQVLRTDTGTVMNYAIKFYLACGFEPCGYIEHDFSLGSKQLHFYIDLTRD